MERWISLERLLRFKKRPQISFSEVVNALMSLIFAQMFLGVCRFSVCFDITKELAPAIAQSLTSK